MIAMQPSDVESTYADASVLHRKLGFAPEVQLGECMKAFAAQYKYYANNNLEVVAVS